MNREQKIAEVAHLKSSFQKARLAVFADYKGLSVSEVTELRQKLRERTGRFKVVKNRLAKIALKDTPLKDFEKYFRETTAIAVTEDDAAGTAKVLHEFSKGHEKLVIRLGILNGQELPMNRFKELANMPSRDELVAKMLGSLLAPARNLVGVLAQIPRQVVQVLSAIKIKKEQEERTNP